MIEMNKMPAREDVLVGPLLERNALERPDEVFVTFEGAPSWTRQEALDKVRSAANVLIGLGIGHGDRVGVFLENGPEILATVWATSMIGAVAVPINISFRGEILNYLLTKAQPKAVVVDSRFADRLDTLSEAASGFLRILASDIHGAPSTPPNLPRQVELRDTQFLIMTSGTTGPSKLALVSHLQTYIGGAALVIRHGLNEQDVLLVDLPLFHMAAQYFSMCCLATRTKMAVRIRPSMQRYWEVIQETQATSAIMLSTMSTHLTTQPSRPIEREHALRTVMAAPPPRDVAAFKARFGISTIAAIYGSTEAPACIVGEIKEGHSAGYLGVQAEPFEVRLVDENDMEVEDGKAGEAIVRSAWPWSICVEYAGDPAATARAWRNGWFHTGDNLRKGPNGGFYYVDRAKDALRRRGENVSAFEVEAVVAQFEGVKEAACVAYPSDSGVDDEVKVWIVPAEGTDIQFGALLRYCVDQLPHFMVPRYFEPIDQLPRTHTDRIQKFKLREQGNGADTWDALAHGYSVTRHGLQVA